MKKSLLSMGAILALTVSTSLNAQIYSEDFENPAAWDATTSWGSFQNDADTNQWGLYDLSTSTNAVLAAMGGVAGSASWNTVPLTPDNFIYSPPINLTTYTETALSFKYIASNPAWPAENFSVYVVKNSADLATATPVYTETIAVGGVLYTKTVNISALSGTADADSVRIVFRHHDCSDNYYLFIDDVQVTDAAGLNKVEAIAVSAFPNPVVDVLNINLKENISSVTIMSTEGKVISSNLVNNLNTASVNVAELVSGVYMYQVKTSNGVVVTNKFVKK
jgi:hypothetical protein